MWCGCPYPQYGHSNPSNGSGEGSCAPAPAQQGGHHHSQSLWLIPLEDLSIPIFREQSCGGCGGGGGGGGACHKDESIWG